jgi:hypothetical protein
MYRITSLAALLSVSLLRPAIAQDSCDVVVHLDDTQAVSIVAFGVDYSAAGGDFIGDSSLPSLGGSWGSEPLACTALIAGLNEATLIDDNAGLLSAFLFRNSGGITGPADVLSCVFLTEPGFPCPDATDFAIANASFPDDPMPPPIVIPPAPAMSISVSPRTPVCGDGFREGTEECDDGNADESDCCAACESAVPGTACDDASVCTSGETCDAEGLCVAASTLQCDDGVFCTADSCDPQLGCIAEEAPNTHGDCGHWKGSLDLRDDASNDAKDGLRLKLALNGDFPIGDPTDSTSYAVCVFDQTSGDPLLADKLEIPAGALWSGSGASGNFRYVDSSRANDGIDQIRLLKKPTSPRAKFLLKAKGPNLTLPGPAAEEKYFTGDPSVVVQIENDAGGCWIGGWRPGVDKIKENEPTRYRAKN